MYLMITEGFISVVNGVLTILCIHYRYIIPDKHVVIILCVTTNNWLFANEKYCHYFRTTRR